MVGLLQLVGVLVLAVLALLALDAGVHPLFLHLRAGQVEVSVRLQVVVLRLVRGREGNGEGGVKEGEGGEEWLGNEAARGREGEGRNDWGTKWREGRKGRIGARID